MNIETELELVTARRSHRFSLGDCALVSVWLLLMFMYATFLATSGDTNLDLLGEAICGSAVLCACLGKSHAGFGVAVAIPLFGLALWFQVPTRNAGLLAIGCGGVIVLTFGAIRGSRIEKENLRIAATLPLFVVLVAFVNSQIAHLTPHTFDALLLKSDFGVGAAVRRWTLAHPLLLVASDGFYVALPPAAALVIAYTTGGARTRLLRALCLAALLSMPCYFLMPAVGPVHIGQPSAWRNCMPSLHLTWASLLWLNARPVWLRWSAFAFVLITAFTTLATGEHYVLDLVAAVPFTWAVQRLSEPTA